MAITAEELRILIRAETKQAQNELRRFQRSSKDTKTSLKDLAKQLAGPLSVTAGIALLAKGAKDFITNGIRMNAQIEQITVGFQTLTGSAETANDLMRDLTDFASSTPLQLGNLAQGAQNLMSFGTSASNVVETMTMLGNAAMGNQQRLDRLVDAYGKVQAKGRASMEEINRFTEAGVPLMRALSEHLGITNEELFKFVSQGKVGFADVAQALEALTTGEGQFAGMLEVQSQTLTGVLSTMRDNISLLAATLVDNFLPGIKNAATGTSNFAKAIRQAIEDARDLRDSVEKYASGEFTLADEIKVAQKEYDELKEEYDRMKADLRELEDFLGPKKAQYDPGWLDMAWEVSQFAKEVENAEIHLKSLQGQQEIEEKARADAEKEKQRLLELEAAYASVSSAMELYRKKFDLVPDWQDRVADFDAAIDSLGELRNTIRDLGGEYSELQQLINLLDDMKDTLVEIGDATKTSFNPLGMMPQTFQPQASPMWSDLISGNRANIRPGDLPISDMLGQLNRVDWQAEISKATMGGASGAGMKQIFSADFIGTANLEEAKRVLGGFNKAVSDGVAVLPEWYEEILKARNAADQLSASDLWTKIGEGSLQAAMSSMVSTFSQMAESMVYAGENAKSLEEILTSSFASLMNSLSQVFLAGAYAAFINGQLELGLVFLALAGITGVVGGLASGHSRNLADARSGSGNSDLPDPSTVRRGTTHEGETVIINYNGDVFTHDEREATTLATVARAGGNR